MAIHSFRYRYTKEVTITVDDNKALGGGNPQDVADVALGSYFDLGIGEDDEEGTVHLGGVRSGITANIVKKGSWNSI
jgi:hypothetical protein